VEGSTAPGPQVEGSTAPGPQVEGSTAPGPQVQGSTAPGPQVEGSTALHRAALSGNVEVVDKLLATGAAVDATSDVSEP
jgi:hypothetical protein